ncbi:hypothetical protein [Streptomyces sp. NPDC056660]|uniref:hypothetical protein n=1 Tax=Streptomyces sp. NPDC056660 TaxID=3345897 RepID=UPI0036983E75
MALRRAGLSRRQIRDRPQVDNNDIVNRLLRASRPRNGRSTRTRRTTCGTGLARPERKRTPEESSAIARRGQEATPQRRENERRHTRATAEQAVGELSDREVFLTGVVLYWAEGAKDKSHNRGERLQFINSDPDVIGFHLNTSEAYRGCLTICVLMSADLYRRVEGTWYGIVGGATRRPD